MTNKLEYKRQWLFEYWKFGWIRKSIVRAAKKDPTISAINMSAPVSKTSGLTVSASTIGWALEANGLYNQVSGKKADNSTPDYKRQLEFEAKY